MDYLPGLWPSNAGQHGLIVPGRDMLTTLNMVSFEPGPGELLQAVVPDGCLRLLRQKKENGDRIPNPAFPLPSLFL